MAATKSVPAARLSRSKPKVKKTTRVPGVLLRSSTVSRWGNSLAFRIPRDIADKLKLAHGERVNVEMTSGSFTVRPVRKAWTEDELLRGVTPDMVGGEIDWGKPVGKEV